MAASYAGKEMAAGLEVATTTMQQQQQQPAMGRIDFHIHLSAAGVSSGPGGPAASGNTVATQPSQQRQASIQLIALNVDVLNRMRHLGAQKGLASDTQIVSFLLQHYEDSASGKPQCVKCHATLNLEVYCSECNILTEEDAYTRYSGPSGPAASDQMPHVSENFNSTVPENLSCGPSGLTSADENSIASGSMNSNVPEELFEPDDSESECLTSGDADDLADREREGDGSSCIVSEVHSVKRLFETPTRCVKAELAAKLRAKQANADLGCTSSNNAQNDTAQKQTKKRTLKNKKTAPGTGTGTGIEVSEASVSKTHTMQTRTTKRKKIREIKERAALVRKSRETELAAAPQMSQKEKNRISYLKRRGRPYTCRDCDESFVFWADFSEHLFEKHDERGSQKCLHCEAVLLGTKDIKLHGDFHLKDKPNKCPLCSATFATTTGLRDHTLSHKPGGFLCSVCGKGFKRDSNLKDHMHVHTGEKQFQCHFCPHRTALRAGFKAHLRTHTGEKPFKCQYCPAEFGKRDVLVCHIRTHTGERPYVCEYCQARFTVLAALIRHRRRKHKPACTGSAGMSAAEVRQVGTVPPPWLSD